MNNKQIFLHIFLINCIIYIHQFVITFLYDIDNAKIFIVPFYSIWDFFISIWFFIFVSIVSTLYLLFLSYIFWKKFTLLIELYLYYALLFFFSYYIDFIEKFYFLNSNILYYSLLLLLSLILYVIFTHTKIIKKF